MGPSHKGQGVSKYLVSELRTERADDSVDGLIVQVPTVGVNTDDIVAAIALWKDVEGLRSPFITPGSMGILQLLFDHDVQIKGKHAVVIGTSVNLGLACTILLEREGVTVTQVYVNADSPKL
jgi:methylenetetrahydrofolate dehydrogenase (NADP+)/methenyltetrahydrofolate cyclohydrolase